jgi:hypothetical protein
MRARRSAVSWLPLGSIKGVAAPTTSETLCSCFWPPQPGQAETARIKGARTTRATAILLLLMAHLLPKYLRVTSHQLFSAFTAIPSPHNKEASGWLDVPDDRYRRDLPGEEGVRGGIGCAKARAPSRFG